MELSGCEVRSTDADKVLGVAKGEQRRCAGFRLFILLRRQNHVGRLGLHACLSYGCFPFFQLGKCHFAILLKRRDRWGYFGLNNLFRRNWFPWLLCLYAKIISKSTKKRGGG